MVYHTIRPHNALMPVPLSPDQTTEQNVNESAWCRMVVNQVLSLVLPPEDLENPCLHLLVSEVLSEMIFHNGICGKASEGWLIWEGITKVIYSARPDLARLQQVDLPQIDRLEQFGLLTHDRSQSNLPGQKSKRFGFEALVRGFWAALQTVSLIWNLLRSFAVALMQAPSLPARPTQSQAGKVDSMPAAVRLPSENDAPKIHFDHSGQSHDAAGKTPILGMSIWNCVSTLTHLHQRMPWLTGLTSLMQWLLLYGPGQVCYTDSRIDR